MEKIKGRIDKNRDKKQDIYSSTPVIIHMMKVLEAHLHHDFREHVASHAEAMNQDWAVRWVGVEELQYLVCCNLWVKRAGHCY